MSEAGRLIERGQRLIIGEGLEVKDKITGISRR
jgi:hypothetical protein